MAEELPVLREPLIRGLYLALPPPGARWPEDRRHAWLAAAAHIFEIVYWDDTPAAPPAPPWYPTGEASR